MLWRYLCLFYIFAMYRLWVHPLYWASTMSPSGLLNLQNMLCTTFLHIKVYIFSEAPMHPLFVCIFKIVYHRLIHLFQNPLKKSLFLKSSMDLLHHRSYPFLLLYQTPSTHISPFSFFSSTSVLLLF